MSRSISWTRATRARHFHALQVASDQNAAVSLAASACMSFRRTLLWRSTSNGRGQVQEQSVIDSLYHFPSMRTAVRRVSGLLIDPTQLFVVLLMGSRQAVPDSLSAAVQCQPGIIVWRDCQALSLPDTSEWVRAMQHEDRPCQHAFVMHATS